MSTLCTKEFFLKVVSFNWITNDFGYGNDLHFVGDSTSASWNPDAALTCWDPEFGFGDACGYIFTWGADITLGPFVNDKDITIDGSIYLRVYNGMDITGQVYSDGMGLFSVAATNLVGYSGDYVASAGPPSPLLVNDVFNLTGILPSGLTCTISLFGNFTSYPIAPECSGNLTITLVDSP